MLLHMGSTSVATLCSRWPRESRKSEAASMRESYQRGWDRGDRRTRKPWLRFGSDRTHAADLLPPRWCVLDAPTLLLVRVCAALDDHHVLSLRAVYPAPLIGVRDEGGVHRGIQA